MQEDTLLHRQIHPNFVQNNLVSSLAFIAEKEISSLSFTPSEKDNKKLSVYNGEKFSAESSFTHYNANFQSCGVLSVTLSESKSVSPLEVHEDNNPFDGHTYIDFSKVENKNQIKKKASQLKNIAIKRNWTFKK